MHPPPPGHRLRTSGVRRSRTQADHNPGATCSSQVGVVVEGMLSQGGVSLEGLEGLEGDEHSTRGKHMVVAFF